MLFTPINCHEKLWTETVDGRPDVEKMQLIVYNPIHHSYLSLGERVGNAFSDGKQLE